MLQKITSSSQDSELDTLKWKVAHSLGSLYLYHTSIYNIYVHWNAAVHGQTMNEFMFLDKDCKSVVWHWICKKLDSNLKIWLMTAAATFGALILSFILGSLACVRYTNGSQGGNTTHSIVSSFKTVQLYCFLDNANFESIPFFSQANSLSSPFMINNTTLFFKSFVYCDVQLLNEQIL